MESVTPLGTVRIETCINAPLLPPDKLNALLRLALTLDRDWSHRTVGAFAGEFEKTHAQPVLLKLHILPRRQQASGFHQRRQARNHRGSQTTRP